MTVTIKKREKMSYEKNVYSRFGSSNGNGPVRLRFTKGSGDNGCTSGGRDNSRPIPG